MPVATDGRPAPATERAARRARTLRPSYRRAHPLRKPQPPSWWYERPSVEQLRHDHEAAVEQQQERWATYQLHHAPQAVREWRLSELDKAFVGGLVGVVLFWLLWIVPQAALGAP